MHIYFRVICGERTILIPAKTETEAGATAAKLWKLDPVGFQYEAIGEPRDLPLFHICDPALDSMGAYHTERILKMSKHGWRYHESGDPRFPGFAYKILKDGKELRFHNARPLLRSATWFAVEVSDKHGRYQGMQYFTWSELTQYQGE